MEYEAEFVEDENSFFKQDLIRECTEDYDLFDEDVLTRDERVSGNYYLGADFGKKVDYSVVALLKEEDNDRFRLVFLKQFPLGTPYTDIVAYIHNLDQKFDIIKGYCDQSAIGESLIEEIRQFAPQVSGLTFTAKTKQDLLTLSQTRMEQKRLTLPLDRELLSQINEQQYRFSRSPVKPTEKPTEAGTLTFFHPQGTHDDQLWALALATYATKQKENEQQLFVTR
jgi:phage FluMu gp28-like protein